MPNPTIWPGAKTFLNLGVETSAQGTAATPTWTYPLESFEPEDVPSWIEDKSMYGDMGELAGVAQGPLHTEWSARGPYFGDGTAFFLHNLLGDLVEDGTYTGAGTTTLSSSAAAGATTISTVASISASTVIAIDAGSGTLAEVRTVQSVSGAGPFTITLNRALSFAHSSAVTVRPVTSPYSHIESLLNSGTGQPGSLTGLGGSLTLIDWQGLTATTQARAFVGCCVSEITLKGNAESQFITADIKGLGWPSAAAASLPTSSATTAKPLEAWRLAVGLAGPASGGTQVKTISEFEITISRKLKAEFTFQNSQNPYLIQRGELGVSGRLVNAVPPDESSSLAYLLANTQPQLQLLISNGLAGASLLSLQIDCQQAAFRKAKIQKQEAIGYAIDFSAVKNTTNAGQSGGRSPVKITMQNAVNQLY